MSPLDVITRNQVQTRNHWVAEIERIVVDQRREARNAAAFRNHSDTLEETLEAEIAHEIAEEGRAKLLGHLRLCGSIPERYGHDTTEEKLYSKYTDIVIAKTFSAMGIQSLVLRERADAADVECVSERLQFVADAKAFRLSRTAKNQKDFKIDAMHGWKRGKPHAVVVCPIYQLPTRTSQIYSKAGQRNVCILSYSHLAVLLQIAVNEGTQESQLTLADILASVDAMNPSTSAVDYWQQVNRAMLRHGQKVVELWCKEKIASNESIILAKEEALTFLADERARIMLLTRDEAIREVIMSAKISNREAAIRTVTDNGLFGIA
ncbi:HindIII family type II restriction endonuclease [Xanthomonas euvesicatoria]|uniref:HindIII family type II restriction endonuclease n=1 Tax=Xanthomonas euvesicatoria TaxID=456327 RepID=UPI001C4656D6|nr:HindIII family type II restriction endonuclease [Xanthomonas euvesicatoria]MBV6777393.1 HindIII family type II restriction endonuclease [Xanthomonas campestris pv. carissae]